VFTELLLSIRRGGYILVGRQDENKNNTWWLTAVIPATQEAEKKDHNSRPGKEVRLLSKNTTYGGAHL
jgi:hypothetical protein